MRFGAKRSSAASKTERNTADKKKPLSHKENGFFFPNVKLKKYLLTIEYLFNYNDNS